VIHKDGAASKHARPNYDSADGKPGDHGKDGQHGQTPGERGHDGIDGDDGQNGTDGQNAVEFDVLIEYKGYDKETKSRTYSVTTVAGGGKSTKVIPNCILNPCFNSDPYRQKG
jgi:hypothetical protein